MFILKAFVLQRKICTDLKTQENHASTKIIFDQRAKLTINVIIRVARVWGNRQFHTILVASLTIYIKITNVSIYFWEFILQISSCIGEITYNQFCYNITYVVKTHCIM